MAGYDDFIRKPYAATELQDALTRHLGVQFNYEDEATKETVGATEAQLDDIAFASLPGELLNGLEQAIDEIRPYAPSVAQALASVAKDLLFGKILRLIHTNADDQPRHHPSAHGK
jgi:hypothetical protein